MSVNLLRMKKERPRDSLVRGDITDVEKATVGSRWSGLAPTLVIALFLGITVFSETSEGNIGVLKYLNPEALIRIVKS